MRAVWYWRKAIFLQYQISSLVQDCSNSIANAMELLLTQWSYCSFALSINMLLLIT